MPWAHHLQRPHAGRNAITTWSPTDHPGVLGPTSTTTPAPSWPAATGSIDIPRSPVAMWSSEWHRPDAATSMSSSSCWGPSRSSSAISHSPGAWRMMAAFVFTCSPLGSRSIRVRRAANGRRAVERHDGDAVLVEQRLVGVHVAGDVGAARAEEHGGLGDDLDGHEGVGRQAVLQVLDGALAGDGLGRVEGVHPDAGAPQLGRHGVGGPVQRRLGGAVDPGAGHGGGHVGRPGQQARRARGDVHDPALALAQHGREDGLGEVERRLDVDLEHDPAPAVREVLHGHVDPGRRVVHQHVDRPAQQRHGLRDDAGPVGRVGQVGGHGLDRPAVAPAPGQRLVQAAGEVVVPVDRAGRDHHGRALGAQPLGQPGTDAPAGARHDDPPPVQSSHGFPALAPARVRARPSAHADHVDARVDHQRLAGDRARLVGRQEQRRHGGLLGRAILRSAAPAADSSRITSAVTPRSPAMRSQYRNRRSVWIPPGTTQFTRTPCGPGLLRRHLGEQAQAALGHRVVALAGHALQGGRRGEVHDRPAPALEHALAQDLAGQQHRPGHDGGDGGVPVLERLLPDVQVDAGVRGVVQQHVDAPEALDGRGHEAGAGLLVGHVGGHDHRRAPASVTRRPSPR